MKKRTVKILVIIFCVPVIIALLGLGAGIWMVVRPWPKTDGTESIAGISGPVRIIRDRWGIPHIYALNERDLLFAQGYVHAQDRLWQMNFNRHLAAGKMSLILGEFGLDTDKHMRTLGYHRAAQKEWERLDNENRRLLQAYADGINAYIRKHGSQLPVEFTLLGVSPSPWAPLDTLVIGRMLSANLTWNFPLELLRLSLVENIGREKAAELMPPYSKDGLVTTLKPGFALNKEKISMLLALISDLKGSTHMQGSNNWVVHGTRTTTGAPLLANDTHLPFSMPSLWYENGLHGGRFDNVGFVFPGVPLIITGHNQRVGWTITDLPADVEDLYVEKFDAAENPTRYEYNGAWYDLEIIEETIEVKGQAPVKVPVYITRHGPVLDRNAFLDLEQYRANKQGLALKSIVNDSNLWKGLVLINLAQNCEEFRRAAASWEFPCEHFIFADTDGNIGYQAAGKFPVRKPGHQGLLPVPGWTDEYEWQGFYKYEDVYGVINPARGFYATANDPGFPAGYALPGIYGLEWSVSGTVNLITGFLKAQERYSIEDMQALQASTYSAGAQSFLPYLLSVKPHNPAQEQALNFVKEWDLRMEKDRVGATIFKMWFWFLVENTILDELGDDLIADYRFLETLPLPLLDAIMPENDNPWFDNIKTPAPEKRDDIVLKSLDDAIAWLSRRYGPAPAKWSWGKFHKLTFIHHPLGDSGIAPLEWLFNGKSIPVRGSEYTVNSAQSTTDGTFGVELGSTQRFILDLGNWDNSLAVNSTGQSAHIFHPHRADMTAMWENAAYHPMLFTAKAVAAARKSLLLLTPAAVDPESE